MRSNEVDLKNFRPKYFLNLNLVFLGGELVLNDVKAQQFSLKTSLKQRE